MALFEPKSKDFYVNSQANYNDVYLFVWLYVTGVFLHICIPCVGVEGPVLPWHHQLK